MNENIFTATREALSSLLTEVGHLPQDYPKTEEDTGGYDFTKYTEALNAPVTANDLAIASYEFWCEEQGLPHVSADDVDLDKVASQEQRKTLKAWSALFDILNMGS